MEVAMASVTRIRIVWELYQAGQKVTYIAERVGVHLATVYRWIKGRQQDG